VITSDDVQRSDTSISNQVALLDLRRGPCHACTLSNATHLADLAVGHVLGVDLWDVKGHALRHTEGTAVINDLWGEQGQTRSVQLVTQLSWLRLPAET